MYIKEIFTILTFAATINLESLLHTPAQCSKIQPSQNWLLWFPQKIIGPLSGTLCLPSICISLKNYCMQKLISVLLKLNPERKGAGTSYATSLSLFGDIPGESISCPLISFLRSTMLIVGLSFYCLESVLVDESILS